MPKFDGYADVGRESLEGLTQAVWYTLERGRELEEHRAESAAQPARPIEHQADRLGRRGQTLDVGEVAAGLHGDDETRGRGLAPGLERRSFRETVERPVRLDRREPSGKVGEPLGRREATRV